MARLALVVLLLLALPALAAPVPKAVQQKSPPVAGTSWHDAGNPFGACAYTFEANGRLSYQYDGQRLYSDVGDWKADGAALTWHTHDHYADFEVTFRDGKFHGTAKNKEGKTWAVELVKKDN